MKKVVVILIILILNISGAFAYEKGEILIEPKPVLEKVTTFTVVSGNGVTTHIANIHAAKGLKRAASVGGTKGVVPTKKKPIKKPIIEPIKEPIKEPIEKPIIEPIKELPKEPIEKPIIEPIKELPKDPVKELQEIKK